MSTTFIIIAVVIALLVGYVLYNYNRMKNIKDVPNSSNVKILTDKNFKLQTKTGIVLVDFWASWCVPCKLMSPILNDIADTETDQVRVAKINVEKEQQLANKFKVRNIPTLIILKNGKEVKRLVGVKTKKAIMQEVANLN